MNDPAAPCAPTGPLARTADQLADGVTRLIRRATFWGAGYALLTLAVLNTMALLGPLQLMPVTIMVALAIAGMASIPTLGLVDHAAERLRSASHPPVDKPGSWGVGTLFLLLLLAASTALVVEQARISLTVTAPITATLDNCDRTGRNIDCSGSWTVAGTTYSSDRLIPADNLTAGDTVTVLYAPDDPGYVRIPGQWASPGGILGALGLPLAIVLLTRVLPRERHRRLAYLAACTQRDAPSA
ncbi:hypothetical protein [Kitasatospora sp. NBC_00315]|uniref:hypothetical protein n=1 Tax=Kitasatospora sp. NBC_00315 TaxID=2975963 RepID=UPI0032531856